MIGEIENYPSRRFSVRLNGGDPLSPLKVVKKDTKRNIFHYGLPLSFGMNSIQMTIEEGKKIITTEKREAFFYSLLAPDFIPPAHFKRLPFHLKDQERQCSVCHRMEPKKEDFAPPPKGSTCYPCHYQITSSKEVHGPASIWACLLCHVKDSSPTRYSTPKPVRDVCYRCHQDQKEVFFKSKFQHGPTSTGMCTICHNPHGTDNPFWLKKPPWFLCTTCHSEKASERHVIAWGPSGQSHPTRSKPDPTRPQMEFACNSCHNPHAADAPFLWNFNAVTRGQLCTNCHGDKF